MSYIHGAAKSGVVLLLHMSMMFGVGCVNHDYDLTEDIDMTIQVGGSELTLPGSSTDLLTLEQIFDLESQSSIIAVSRDGDYGLSAGDYVLLQEGATRPSEFSIERVDLRDIQGSSGRMSLPSYFNDGRDRITRRANPTINVVRLSDDEVTPRLLSLSSAKMEVNLLFEVGYSSEDYSGTAYIDRGYRAVFPDNWTIELADATAREYLALTDAHTVEFKQDAAVSKGAPFRATVRLTEVDFSEAEAGQGLYSPGHFRLDADVTSEGDVTILSSDIAAGESVTLTLETRTDVLSAEIERVTGVVDPEISVSQTDFELRDIPEFLKDSENHLDVENPMIYVRVQNTSPLELSLNGEITSYTGGSAMSSCYVGSDYGRPVEVHGNGETVIVFSRRAVNVSGATNVVVPELGDIVSTLPDKIVFHNATCRALPIEAEYILGHEYDFDCDYEAVVPFAFGAEMRLHYSHEDRGWNEDLYKYNFNTVEITLEAVNSIPMNLRPTADALDISGDVLTDITAEVDGVVSAGSISSPSRSELKITLCSRGANIGALDGIKLVFDGTTSAEYVGMNLNKAQNLRFENIKITVRGGLTVDLNE